MPITTEYLAKRKPRPKAQTVSKASIERLLDEVSTGMSLFAACKAAGISYGAVLYHIAHDERLTELDARARLSYAQAKVALMAEVARDEPDVQRARLICDNTKWEVSRICRKLYGDREETVQPGAQGGRFVIEHAYPDGRTFEQVPEQLEEIKP